MALPSTRRFGVVPRRGVGVARIALRSGTLGSGLGRTFHHVAQCQPDGHAREHPFQGEASPIRTQGEELA